MGNIQSLNQFLVDGQFITLLGGSEQAKTALLCTSLVDLVTEDLNASVLYVTDKSRIAFVEKRLSELGVRSAVTIKEPSLVVSYLEEVGDNEHTVVVVDLPTSGLADAKEIIENLYYTSVLGTIVGLSLGVTGGIAEEMKEKAEVNRFVDIWLSVSGDESSYSIDLFGETDYTGN